MPNLGHARPPQTRLQELQTDPRANASDAATIAGLSGSLQPAYAGSGMPGAPWRSVNPEPPRRGALR
jgi:hypothetical protein